MADIKRIHGEGMLRKMATVPSRSATNIKDRDGLLVLQQVDHFRDLGGKAELIASGSLDQCDVVRAQSECFSDECPSSYGNFCLKICCQTSASDAVMQQKLV